MEDKREKASFEPCSSSTTLTWDENDVMELENCIGELNAELAELRKETRSNSAEYTRNKAAVSNFRDKYDELTKLKEQVKAMRAEIDGLKAERSSRRRAPPPSQAERCPSLISAGIRPGEARPSPPTSRTS